MWDCNGCVVWDSGFAILLLLLGCLGDGKDSVAVTGGWLVGMGG